MPSRQHRLPLSSSLCLLFLLTSSASAQLVCVSPSSYTSPTLQPGTPLSLKFTNKQPSTLGSVLLSDVSANLICTSTRDSVLTLASKLEPGKSFSATISQEEAASALKACPVNSFFVQYEESSLLSKETENCAGTFSIQLGPIGSPDTERQQPEQPAITLPPISVPVPDVPSKTITQVDTTATGSPSTSPTIVEPQPSITAPVPPIEPTTTAIIPSPTTTAGVVPPPNPATSTSSAGIATSPPHKNPPPSATSITTRPPKSGGNHNDDGDQDPQPTTPPTNSSGDIISSDMQQSTGSGPTTASIAGMSIGVVAGIFVILGAMLVWRRRSQRRADFDLFITDSLAAASGFQARGSGSCAGATTTTSSAEQPIYGRSAPEDEKYDMTSNANNGGSNNHAASVSRKASSNAPRRSRSHTSTHTRHPNNRSPIPPSSTLAPSMPMHPYPVAGNGGQDSSYYQQDFYYNSQHHQHHHQPEYYTQQQHQQHHAPPQRKPSYKLPRQHPAFDYDDYSY